jgi:hypothetical protein
MRNPQGMTVSRVLLGPLERAGGRARHGHTVLALLAGVDALVERLRVIGGINRGRACVRRSRHVVALGARLNGEHHEEENCSGFHRNELADLAACSRPQPTLIPATTPAARRGSPLRSCPGLTVNANYEIGQGAGRPPGLANHVPGTPGSVAFSTRRAKHLRLSEIRRLVQPLAQKYLPFRSSELMI